MEGRILGVFGVEMPPEMAFFVVFFLFFREISHKSVVPLLCFSQGRGFGGERRRVKSLQTALIGSAKPQKCRNYKEI